MDHDLTHDEQTDDRSDGGNDCAHEPACCARWTDYARKNNEKAASEGAHEGINARSVFASLQIPPGHKSHYCTDDDNQ